MVPQIEFVEHFDDNKGKRFKIELWNLGTFTFSAESARGPVTRFTSIDIQFVQTCVQRMRSIVDAKKAFQEDQPV
ncbi:MULTISPECIES: hypothetical protein [Exiguobacterium]|jgi:hypothetical protein|uniref:hypothetical protein n=1 Tax=Exiguobacterium TaxID=33986 RepID=UPI0004459E68|nr:MULTISPECIES: hypothetical protein [unclassified Exiguobacterium]EZP59284.1 hypothetical protein BW42_02406 [Exiguobacterium sp. RIT341]KQS37755.1 hypothetical protein ASG02_12320 [Exiguobacterium sp. Leaf196]HAB33159.1 hypothetical protein [Exiguobacterium sp.]